MSETTGAHWYFREGGAVTSAAWDVTDPAPYLRHNAYAKAWRGEALSDSERAAMASAPAGSAGAVSGNMAGDVLLGMIAHHKPEALEALDRMADDLADGLGLPSFMVWQALADYTERATAVVLSEVFASPPPSDPAEEARQVAAVKAWEESEEGRRAAEATAPDDGPEGWSQIPPTNPAHPCHPNNRRG